MFPGLPRDRCSEALEKAERAGDARPENLSVAEFQRLYNQIMANN